MKKLSALMALVLVMATLLTACGGNGAQSNGGKGDAGGASGTRNDASEADKSGETEYPALDLPDVSGLALTEADGGAVKFSYNADKWTPAGDGTAMLYYNDTIGADSKVNFTVNYETDMEELGEGELEDLKSAMMSEDMSFMSAKIADFYSVDGNKVIVLDIGITDLEAYVDYIIENAGLTEEDLEPMGGREGLLENMPATSQLMFYFIKDGHLFSASGVYFDDAQRQDMMELFAAVYTTVEKA